MKIAYKLVLTVLILTTVASITVLLTSSYLSTRMIDKRIEAQLESVAVLKEEAIKRQMEHEIESFGIFAENKLLREINAEMFSLPDLDAADMVFFHRDILFLLEEHLRIHPTLLDIYILDTTGEIHLSTDSLMEGQIRSSESYFDKGMSDTSFQSFYYSTSRAEPAFTISAPIRDMDGSTVAVIAGDLDLSVINQIMLEASGLGETGETYLVNRFNYLITDSRFEPGSAMKKIVSSEGISSCLKGNSGHARYLDYRGVPVWGTYKYLDAYNVCLLAEINVEEATTDVRLTIRFLALIALALSLAVVSANALISRKIVAPLRKLQAAAEAVENRDFSTRLNIVTEDELEELGVAFNRMMTVLGVLEEERKQIDKMKSRFLSITSHELRSPMTPIKAQLQMLSEGYLGRLNSAQKKSIAMVLENADRLDRILLDFLDISRIEAAKLKFNFKKVNLAEIAKGVVESMELFLPEKKVHITTDIQKLPSIKADPDRFSQVLRNLINNAIKFSRTGGHILIKGRKENDHLLFSVQDDGIGIPSRVKARISEPFFQGEQTIYRKYGGTGLGLAISRGIIESQNGKLWFESEEGEGTTFYFTVPLQPVTEIKPIMILFSPKEKIDAAVKKTFVKYLGPLGEYEFHALSRKGITSESVLDHFEFLHDKGVLIDEQHNQAKQEISTIFRIQKSEVKGSEVKGSEVKRSGRTKLDKNLSGSKKFERKKSGLNKSAGNKPDAKKSSGNKPVHKSAQKGKTDK